MATKKKLTEEQEKEIKLLQANNEMLEKTKEEAKLRGNQKSVERIQLAQNDVLEQLRKAGGEPTPKPSRSDNTIVASIIENNKSDNDDIETVFDSLKSVTATNENTHTIVEEVAKVNNSVEFNNVDSSAQYDIVALPSNGECYKNKMSRIPVAYLTAYDENFITSPNLYRDGLIIDFLLKHKIMNTEINIDELCKGDVDAIILFLRATSYGPEFPITAKDPQSGQNVDGVVDLSKLKTKEFTLKGDENGWFEFILPQSKDIVKFRFLTRADEKNLKLLGDLDNNVSRSTSLRRAENILRNAVQTDTLLSGKEKQEHMDYIEKLKAWEEKVREQKGTPYTKLITNRLEMAVMSINGNTDRKFIAKYVHNMNALDSLKLRRYMNENEPGIDFEVDVERPESLGGGSFKSFLEWDDAVFLNIA